MASCERPARKRDQFTAAVGYAALGVTIALLAVPFACYMASDYAYSYGRYGMSPGARVRTKRRQRGRYTEKQWRNKKRLPEPEMLVLSVLDLDEDLETRQKRLAQEEEDRVMGIISVSEQNEHVPTQTIMRGHWKPSGRFRFMDLPGDVQILVLEQLITETPGKKWSACAGFCKDGFLRYPPVISRRTKKPTGVLMLNTYALWRTNSTPITTSLLLTSRKMHDLTNAALGCTFSGTFKFQTRQRTSLLDTPWQWDSITSQSPVVIRNQWLFSRVRLFETPQLLSVWTHVLSVMPNLERIRLTPSYIGGKCGCLWGTRQRPTSNEDWRILSHQTPSEAALVSGQHWTKWCKQREVDGQHTVQVSIMGITTCVDRHMQRHMNVFEMELWPKTGKIIRHDNTTPPERDDSIELP